MPSLDAAAAAGGLWLTGVVHLTDAASDMLHHHIAEEVLRHRGLRSVKLCWLPMPAKFPAAVPWSELSALRVLHLHEAWDGPAAIHQATLPKICIELEALAALPALQELHMAFASCDVDEGAAAAALAHQQPPQSFGSSVGFRLKACRLPTCGMQGCLC